MFIWYHMMDGSWILFPPSCIYIISQKYVLFVLPSVLSLEFCFCPFVTLEETVCPWYSDFCQSSWPRTQPLKIVMDNTLTRELTESVVELFLVRGHSIPSAPLSRGIAEGAGGGCYHFSYSTVICGGWPFHPPEGCIHPVHNKTGGGFRNLGNCSPVPEHTDKIPNGKKSNKQTHAFWRGFHLLVSVLLSCYLWKLLLQLLPLLRDFKISAV